MKHIKLFESFTPISENLKYHIDNNIPVLENVFRPHSEAFYNLIKEARELFDGGKIGVCNLDQELFETTDLGHFGVYEGQTVPLDLPIENIEEINEAELNSPHQMMAGYQYKITEPDYDEDGLEPYIVEVIKKMNHGFLLKDIKHNFTFERTFQHLMTCEIEDVNKVVNEAEYKGREVELNKPTRSSGPKKYKVYVKNPKTSRVKVVNFGDVKGGLSAKVSDPKARKSFISRHNCKRKWKPSDKLSAGYWSCHLPRYKNIYSGTYSGYW